MPKNKRWTSYSYFSIFMSLAVLTGSTIGTNISNTAHAADPYAPKSQTISETVQAEPVLANHGTYWYQLDSGRFKADYGEGSVTVSNAGNRNDPFHANEQVIPDSVYLSNYPATPWDAQRLCTGIFACSHIKHNKERPFQASHAG
ncbi:hypothetical protein JJQ72_10965 [Paenibacillus sp. F411]|uniref:hypothetical protein n=1 Tax=Paenibacillus sp. F411 TaxID=2820239 RepID=UPI001AAFCC29|nr:hypothetical protein [Paenibacillus sp. F411]MBO2944488.1 hypothetical protein [Paenibacillus sp. F411]